jgi:diguanylate cyclase (GGDEF)-like protein
MPRFTTKLFNDLAIWMIGFGLLIGVSFPFFALRLGVSYEQAMSLGFWLGTLAAGLVAGTINFLLAQLVVRPRLRLLAEHMHIVERTIRGATYTGDWSSCSTEGCRVMVDSDDEIGESAGAFNDLVDALFRSHEIEAAVSAFSKALSSQLELDTLCRQALDLMLQHTRALAGVVMTESSGELVVTANHGLRDAYLLKDSDHIRKAMRTGECHKVEFPENVRIEALLADFRPCEIMVVPVEFKKTTLGVVVLASSRPFAPEVSWLLQLFRQGLGLALNNALTHDNLQRMAALDTLTGAYNRRFGLTRLREEYNRAVRSDGSVGVLMMDVDLFKSVNDTYGHLVGDRVLTKVTESARRALREGDFMVRYGGEEFVIVLPGASNNDSALIAERIRRIVAETVVRDGEQLIGFTVSLGVTSFPEDNVEQEQDLLKHADEALYQAKHQGRNQVVVARL